MLKIITVCGNGIGSSLMLKMKIEEICAENNIQADVESIDFNAAQGKQADLLRLDLFRQQQKRKKSEDPIAAERVEAIREDWQGIPGFAQQGEIRQIFRWFRRRGFFDGGSAGL